MKLKIILLIFIIFVPISHAYDVVREPSSCSTVTGWVNGSSFRYFVSQNTCNHPVRFKLRYKTGGTDEFHCKSGECKSSIHVHNQLSKDAPGLRYCTEYMSYELNKHHGRCP